MPLKIENHSRTPGVVAPLHRSFCPAIVTLRKYRKSARVPLLIGLEREGSLLSRFETVVRADESPESLRYVERIVKFLLWARGGWKLYLGGPRSLLEQIQIRRFDAEMMGRVYGRPMEVALLDARAVQRRTSREHRDLFEATLKEIEAEAKARSRRPDRRRRKS